jgi:hypothetical protein
MIAAAFGTMHAEGLALAMIMILLVIIVLA